MNFEIEKLPKKISPCPITEAVVEMRFESKLPPEVIPGIAFNSLKGIFPKIETLPVMQLPPVIRDNDPNLKFSPQYKLSNSDFIFQIGPRCFSVVCPKEYKGWTKYSEQIDKAFEAVQKMGIIEKPLRVGVRYISFFENTDIFKNLKVEMKLAGNSLIGSQNILRSEFEYANFKCVVQLANSATLNSRQKGSSIDIDVITDNNSTILSNFKAIVNSAHDLEKKLFFSFIDPEFLKKFNPEY